MNKPSILSCSSEVMPSSLFAMFVALLWTHSNIFVSLHCGARIGTQYFR